MERDIVSRRIPRDQPRDGIVVCRCTWDAARERARGMARVAAHRTGTRSGGERGAAGGRTTANGRLPLGYVDVKVLVRDAAHAFASERAVERLGRVVVVSD